MTDKTHDPCGSDSSTELGLVQDADLLCVARRHGQVWKPVAPDSQVLAVLREAGALFVAAERERLIAAAKTAKDTGDATGIERDVYLWNRAIDHCIGRLLRA